MDEKILHLMHFLEKKSFFKQTLKILIILKSEVTLGKGARFAPLINLQLSLVPWEERMIMYLAAITWKASSKNNTIFFISTYKID